MKLKNEALQKLYDKLGFDTLVFGISRQSQIDKAFIECDEELSDSITFAQIKDLQDRCDIFEKSNGTLLGANLDLATKKRQLEKQLDYFTQSRDDWRARAKHAEDEVMETTETLEKVNADRNKLRKKLDFQQNDIVRLRKDRDRKDETIAKLAEMRDELQQKADDLKNELQAIRKDHGRLHEENKKLNDRTCCLRGEVMWYGKQYDKQSAKIEELKTRLNSVYGVCGAGYEQGQTDLWDMLQNVNDAKPFELAACFQDVSCMGDILSWDLEDFLDAYKSWQEKNEQERIDDMRGYLDWFCMGRACCKCPLRTDEFKCGRGIWFRDIADEDIQRYYKKVREYYRDDNK